MKQTYTSAGTSLNQIPAIWRLARETQTDLFWAENSRTLDYGGGKFDTFTEHLAERGITNLIVDPHNRPEHWNISTMAQLYMKPADVAFCSNVLNVIKEPAVRQDVLSRISELTKEYGMVFFTTYEGDKSSYGRKTCRGWQNNRPTQSYLREIKKVFPQSERKGKLIISINNRV